MLQTYMRTKLELTIVMRIRFSLFLDDLKEEVEDKTDWEVDEYVGVEGWAGRENDETVFPSEEDSNGGDETKSDEDAVDERG